MRRLPDDPAANSCGFTLLELLIAITLLSFLTIALYFALELGARSMDRARVDSTGAREIAIAQRLLRTELESAYPYFSSEGGRYQVRFEGADDHLSFLGSDPGGDAPGRHEIRLEVVHDDGRRALALVSRPELALDTALPRRIRLVDRIERASFRYFGRHESDGLGRWGPSWTGRTRLPELIEIKVSFAGTDERSWPTLLIAPRLSADAGCIYDPLTNYCQGR